MHDVFAWWANIWIPAFVGLATGAVAVIALLVSHRAETIARDSERARLGAVVEQQNLASRDRLLDMAQDESRLLRKYVILNWQRRLGSGPAQDSDPETARVDAEVALEHSFVPGGSDLWKLTKLEVDTNWTRMPAEAEQILGVHNSAAAALRNDISERRRVRTIQRLSRWGRDPQSEVDSIRSDLRGATDDLDEYLTHLFD